MKYVFGVIFLVASLVVPLANAQNISLGGLDITLAENNEEVASAFQILILLSVLSLAPALVVMLTAFTRIIVVLAMLRHAFGMPTTPPNTVIISLALFLTLFTMLPVLNDIEQNALTPYRVGEMSSSDAVKKGLDPLREFMFSQTREEDLVMILTLSELQMPASPDELSNAVLIPAFMISELQTAFQIGFVLFLPFLAIDLIAASVLMAMGMIMVPPLTVSLPIKIMMFVLIDGWSLVVQALVGSFG